MNDSVSSGHATTDRLSDQAHESVDRIARTAGKGEEKIRHEAGSAEARAREAGQRVRERIDETLNSVNVFVRENPIISLGLAFAAGTFLSALKRLR